MNEQDKAFARQALESKALTIEQVQEIRLEVDRSGRSFEEVAVAKGLLARKPPIALSPPKAVPPPPPPPPRPAADRPQRISPLYLALLGASFLIFVGLLGWTLAVKDRLVKVTADEALEISQARKESDRTAVDASRGYKRARVSGNEAAAREQLAKARAAMARVDAMTKDGATPPQVEPILNEAFVAYNMYLKELPDDANVRIERSRTHQLRRNYDLAIADLERAIELNPELAPSLKERIAQLRLFIARNPR